MTDQELAVYARQLATRYAARLSLSHHMVDELAQEAAMGLLMARAKYQPGKQSFKTFAFMWADYKMRDHLNSLGGVVNNSSGRRATRSVAVLGTDESGPGWRDDRTEEPTAHDDAAYRQVLGRAEPRVQLMVEARVAGRTVKEIAAALGHSRAYVKKCLDGFLADVCS